MAESHNYATTVTSQLLYDLSQMKGIFYYLLEKSHLNLILSSHEQMWNDVGSNEDSSYSSNSSVQERLLDLQQLEATLKVCDQYCLCATYSYNSTSPLLLLLLSVADIKLPHRHRAH